MCLKKYLYICLTGSEIYWDTSIKVAPNFYLTLLFSQTFVQLLKKPLKHNYPTVDVFAASKIFHFNISQVTKIVHVPDFVVP